MEADPRSLVPPHLTAAQRRLSAEKRQRVKAALQSMVDEGGSITFAEVARRASVSRSLVYSDELRGEIEAARKHPSPTGRPSRAVSVPRSEIQLLKNRNEKLRNEAAELRRALRDKLGAEVEFGDATSLRQEIVELRQENADLRTQLAESGTQLDQERAQRVDAEDALTASRELVKKMIREASAPTALPDDL